MDNLIDKKILGRTNLLVSRLGLASGYGINAYGVQEAFNEYGINYFFWSSPRKHDFANGIRNLTSTNRDKIVIAIQTYDHLGIFINYFVEKGLKTLGIDYADILILGWFNYVPTRKIMESALKLKEQGKIRFIGVSGHNRNVFRTMAEMKELPIDVFMIRYNAVHRGAETDIFPHIALNNPQGIVTYTATCWSKLLKSTNLPKGCQPLNASDCYRFVLSNPHVDTCLFGPKNIDQMREALTIFKSAALTDEQIKHIITIGDYIHG
jgi:aryl-alcohol dehydrogenase-like predicted oxidoreductase